MHRRLTEVQSLLVIIVCVLVVPDDGGAAQHCRDLVQAGHRDITRDHLVPGPHDVDVRGQLGSDSFQVLG